MKLEVIFLWFINLCILLLILLMDIAFFIVNLLFLLQRSIFKKLVSLANAFFIIFGFSISIAKRFLITKIFENWFYNLNLLVSFFFG